MTTATTLDPVLTRVEDLQRIARAAHAEDRIDDQALDLATRYSGVVRDVLPRITGWGAAQAALLQSTDQAVALMVRFMRVPSAKTGEAADAWLPHPTITGILTDGLTVLVRYAESLDEAVTGADVARLLELQRAVDTAFGPGFRPATGIGDPARVPEPEPDPDPAPTWGDLLRDLLRSVPVEAWAALITVVIVLIIFTVWSHL